MSDKRPDQQKKKGKKKTRTCRVVDFAVPADHRVKLKESEKRDKYQDLSRELKKLRNMKVTMISVVIGVLHTVTKVLILGLEHLEIRGRVKTIQTTPLLRSARISRSPKDLIRLVVTQTPVKNHQLKLVWKTLNYKLIIIKGSTL